MSSNYANWQLAICIGLPVIVLWLMVSAYRWLYRMNEDFMVLAYEVENPDHTVIRAAAAKETFYIFTPVWVGVWVIMYYTLTF